MQTLFIKAEFATSIYHHKVILQNLFIKADTTEWQDSHPVAFEILENLGSNMNKQTPAT